MDIRPARKEEAVTIASRLRDADRQEIWTATGQHPLVVLPNAYQKSSRVYSIRRVIDGKPVRHPCAMFGVADDPSKIDHGLVWLLATPEVNHIKLEMAKVAPIVLEGLLGKRYAVLHCLVDSRNTMHARWVQKFGFICADTVDIRGVPFLHMLYRSPTKCAPHSPPQA